MSRTLKVVTVFVFVLIGLLSVSIIYNRWHFQKYEASIEANHDTMKYFVNDNEEYIRIAFNRLESEFRHPNDFKLDSYSVRKMDTVFNGLQDTVYNVYFSYRLSGSKSKDRYFSKITVLALNPTLALYNLEVTSNAEYLEIEKENNVQKSKAIQTLREVLPAIRKDSAGRAVLEEFPKDLK